MTGCIVGQSGPDDGDDAAGAFDGDITERGEVHQDRVEIESVPSTVTDTETSDVATTFTDVRCRSKISNTRRRKPGTSSMRADLTLTSAVGLLPAMAVTARRGASKVIRVPRPWGLFVLYTNTGIPSRTAGAIVLGWRTLAPNEANSEASSNPMRSMSGASGTTRGCPSSIPSNISPDLDCRGAECGAHERRRIVGSATPQGGGDAVSSRAHESAHHRYARSPQMRQHDLPGRGGDRLCLRLGLGEIGIGDQHGPRIDGYGGQPGAEVGSDDEVGRQHLAGRGDGVQRSRGEMAEDRQRLEQSGELIAQHAHLLRTPRSRIRSDRAAPRPPRSDGCESPTVCSASSSLPAVACSAAASSALVTPPSAETTMNGVRDNRPRDDLRGRRNRCRGRDGGPAELGDDHETLTDGATVVGCAGDSAASRPWAARTSALSTEPPAAPRTTLCASATRRRSRIGSDRRVPPSPAMPCLAPASRRGCGPVADSVTTNARSGALGRPWATSAAPGIEYGEGIGHGRSGPELHRQAREVPVLDRDSVRLRTHTQGSRHEIGAVPGP